MHLWQNRHFPNIKQIPPQLTPAAASDADPSFSPACEASAAAPPLTKGGLRFVPKLSAARSFLLLLALLTPSTILAQNESQKPSTRPRTAADARTSSDTPRQALQEARDRLIGYSSVKTGIVQTVRIGDRRFTASGSYLHGTDLKLRLEYAVKLNGIEGSLLQVSDGQVLWTRHSIGGEVRVTRRDIEEILKVAATLENIPERMLAAELGLGGLPALLASIERAMTFDTLTRETIGGGEFLVLQGRWKPELVARWGGKTEGGTTRLPDFLPDFARVYLDAENYFPRRILYLKRTEDNKGRPMVTLDFSDIAINAPIPETEFEFVPPEGVVPEDVTNAYLEQIRQATGAAEKGEMPPSPQQGDRRP